MATNPYLLNKRLRPVTGTPQIRGQRPPIPHTVFNPYPSGGSGLEGANKAYGAVTQGAGSVGASAENEYLSRARSFDPSASISKYASSMWDNAVNDPISGLKKSLSDLRGGAVGAGRLDTGFFDEDQGTVMHGAVRDYNNMIGRTAIEGTRMEQENTAGIGAYGERKTNQYLDLMTADRDKLENDAREKAERKRKKKRGIGSLIGGAVGAVAGSFIPGVGTMAGWGAGSAVGGGFG